MITVPTTNAKYRCLLQLMKHVTNYKDIIDKLQHRGRYLITYSSRSKSIVYSRSTGSCSPGP